MLRAALVPLVAAALIGCGRAHANGADALPPEATAHARTVRLPDVRLHVIDVGAASLPRLWVLHDGPGFDHTYLRPWLDVLADHSHVTYVDLRGHGRSSAPPDATGYTLSAAAGDLAAAIAADGTDAPVDVLGHGFGAAVAMELASRHPELLRRLVLVDPIVRGRDIDDRAERAQSVLGAGGYARLAALLTPQGTLRDPRGTVELFRREGPVFWHRPPSDAVLDRFGGQMLYRGDADGAFRVALATWDGRLLAHGIRAPTLVLTGADDRFDDPDESRELAEMLPHGRWIALADAGHCPFVEQNARFHTIVDRFVRGDGRPE